MELLGGLKEMYATGHGGNRPRTDGNNLRTSQFMRWLLIDTIFEMIEKRWKTLCLCCGRLFHKVDQSN